MSTEIERKFAVRELPSGLGEGTPFRQGYVAIDGEAEVRVRAAGESCTLTIKGGAGRRRTEVELPLSQEQFDELWRLAESRCLVKRRHVVQLEEGVAELDVYGGALEGLAVVEVEFDSEEDADRFGPPAWFGEELTGRSGWSNAALATRGRPPVGDA